MNAYFERNKQVCFREISRVEYGLKLLSDLFSDDEDMYADPCDEWFLPAIWLGSASSSKGESLLLTMKRALACSI